MKLAAKTRKKYPVTAADAPFGKEAKVDVPNLERMVMNVENALKWTRDTEGAVGGDELSEVLMHLKKALSILQAGI